MYINTIIILVLIGLISGTSIGLSGIGAGVVMMPLLLFSGIMNGRQAVATALAVQAVPETLLGLKIYNDNGHFKWKESLFVILGSIIGVGLGAHVTNNVINEKTMFSIVSLLLIISGLYIYFKCVCNFSFL